MSFGHPSLYHLACPRSDNLIEEFFYDSELAIRKLILSMCVSSITRKCLESRDFLWGAF